MHQTNVRQNKNAKSSHVIRWHTATLLRVSLGGSRRTANAQQCLLTTTDVVSAELTLHHLHNTHTHTLRSDRALSGRTTCTSLRKLALHDNFLSGSRSRSLQPFQCSSGHDSWYAILLVHTLPAAVATTALHFLGSKWQPRCILRSAYCQDPEL